MEAAGRRRRALPPRAQVPGPKRVPLLGAVDVAPVVGHAALHFRHAGAPAEDGEVTGVDLESVPCAGRRGQRPVNSSSGASTAVPQSWQTKWQWAPGGQVVGGRPVTEVGVDHHSQLLELVEVPVDGRQRHVGGPGLDGSASSSAVRWPGPSKSASIRRRRELVTRPPCSRTRASTSSTVWTSWKWSWTGMDLLTVVSPYDRGRPVAMHAAGRGGSPGGLTRFARRMRSVRHRAPAGTTTERRGSHHGDGVPTSGRHRPARSASCPSGRGSPSAPSSPATWPRTAWPPRTTPASTSSTTPRPTPAASPSGSWARPSPDSAGRAVQLRHLHQALLGPPRRRQHGATRSTAST